MPDIVCDVWRGENPEPHFGWDWSAGGTFVPSLWAEEIQKKLIDKSILGSFLDVKSSSPLKVLGRVSGADPQK